MADAFNQCLASDFFSFLTFAMGGLNAFLLFDTKIISPYLIGFEMDCNLRVSMELCVSRHTGQTFSR